MPELPEVETVRRGLNKLTLNQPIQGGEVLLPRTLAYPHEIEEFWQGIRGNAIACWQRRGKYLLAQLEKDSQQFAGWLGVHLRMTGQLLWVDQNSVLQKHTRIRLLFGGDQELRFVDTRTFGKFWYVPPEKELESIVTGLQKLGPEPFSTEFSLKYFTEKLNNRRRHIKTLLLDQAIVAGIGNIYADEALFKSGIKPDTIAANLTVKQIKLLHSSIIDVLQSSIDKGGTTFSDFLNLLGVSGNYGDSALVYGRKEQPCRVCGTPIEKIKLGGRSSHFCPSCQA
ncbi:DNA-formamidopyrimidine glycosylase [Waterburya agarophytonicola K14]|uniref:Formamidopyrimidine-DNA glycosylase n=1 Tax=Waterburya agarophytonicola KI4 TaxID=2874699 RepID=A0A964BQW4_9CYAN|nr:DNA-formamidopyrimidine glycosylase [Waterburya agarophytonicola]MCC0177549.1 DNA-formamidopyrimidine glycosylase [Waterburya agarophytonicola KI4]